MKDKVGNVTLEGSRKPLTVDSSALYSQPYTAGNTCSVMAYLQGGGEALTL